MSQSPRDPLLAAASGIALFMQICVGLLLVGVAAGIPIMLFDLGGLAADMVREWAVEDAGRPDLIPYTVAAMLAVFIAVGLLALAFLAILRRMIASVRAGDPFELANSLRLRTLAWITLAIQLVAVPGEALADWLETHLQDVQLDVEVSLEGILLALVLFILARIFGHGAAMRADLEGTV